MENELELRPIAGRRLRPLYALGAMLIAYLLIAYLVLPFGWRHYAKRHPALDDVPTITYTGSGIPGDPLNVALVGTVDELQIGMLAAKWFPADPITLRSSLRIAAGTVFHRSYDDAPVSDLYVFGRKQDLAFEQPIGNSPKQRHHVRFWRAANTDEQGRPMWFGAATLDTKVGFSHTTGQITHHISADVDDERNKVIDDLQRAAQLIDVYWIDSFQKKLSGKNGGGDPYHTDGRLEVGVLKLREGSEKLQQIK